MGLSEQQKMFALEFVKCRGNARLAAEKTGYKPGTAKDACRWLNPSSKKYKPELAEYIKSQIEDVHTDAQADAAEVMHYLTSVMRGESSAEIVVIEGEGEGVSSARAMNKKPDEKERLKAAELLARILGISTNINVTGSVPVIISGEDELED